jgi:hypothetical protein
VVVVVLLLLLLVIVLMTMLIHLMADHRAYPAAPAALLAPALHPHCLKMYVPAWCYPGCCCCCHCSRQQQQWQHQRQPFSALLLGTLSQS